MTTKPAKRGTFSSKLGVILATAGSAVGLGNIWRFPYITGENGGGAFIILYILIVCFFGIPVAMAEFTIGKTGRANAVESFKKLAPGSKWYYVGVAGIVTAIIILGYYSVVSGWTLEYLIRSAIGDLQGKSVAEYSDVFNDFTANVERPIIWLGVVVMCSFLIIARGVQNGIEKASKILMPTLFVLLIVLAVRALVLPGSGEGMKFLFYPDFSKLGFDALLAALGQTFFSMSVGMGCLITYSSYFDKSVDIFKTAYSVAIVDTLVAVLSAVIIFSAVFSFGMEPSAGPGLVFMTLPNVFQQMAGGIFWAILFYVLLFIASITSIISLFEVVIAYVSETFAMGRHKSALITSLTVFFLGVFCALSFNVLKDATLFDMTIFDLCDYVTAKLIMPLGGLAMTIFVSWRMNADDVKREVTCRGRYAEGFYKVYMFLIRFVAPIGITAIFISSFIGD